jgi:hypothetical protein
MHHQLRRLDGAERVTRSGEVVLDDAVGLDEQACRRDGAILLHDAQVEALAEGITQSIEVCVVDPYRVSWRP